MIKELSESEWNRMVDTRRSLLALGRSTELVDRPRLEKAYRETYRVFLDKDSKNIPVRWVDSPKAAKQLLQKYKNVTVSGSCSWGGIESYWAGYIKFLSTIPGIKGNPDLLAKLDVYMETLHGHLWWPFESEIIACERPCRIEVNQAGRLHRLEGFAIEYRDGYGLCFVDGVSLNKEIVFHPDKLKPQNIKEEKNAEKRRAMLLVYGLLRYIKDTDSKPLDSRPGEVLFEENGQKFLICTDGSTGRIYELPVSNNVNNCKEAQESLSGMPFDSIVMGS